MKLTKKAIDSFKYNGDGQSRDVRWDSLLPGLGLRVYPTGRKAFILSYRVDGRKRQMTIGTFGTITLDQARNKARICLGKIIDGTDPLAEKQKAALGKTFGALCNEYLERYAKPNKKTWRDDARRLNSPALFKWKNAKVKVIKRSDVASLHHQIGKSGPYEANRVLALLSKMFELAKRWGFLDEDAPNPARGIDKYKEEKRDRWVTPEELPRLAKAIDEEENIYVRGALWIYLLLGVRKSELLQAKWEDIDFDRKELRLPETKAGRTHYLPLNQASLKIIDNLPKLDENPFLFPGRRKGKHLINISKPWYRIRKKAKVEDVRLHDLRRTLGSWLAQSGNSLHLIGRVLNHSNTSTTAIYARFAQDQVREALEAHGKQILGIAGKSKIGEVVELPKTKRRKRK